MCKVELRTEHGAALCFILLILNVSLKYRCVQEKHLSIHVGHSCSHADNKWSTVVPLRGASYLWPLVTSVTRRLSYGSLNCVSWRSCVDAFIYFKQSNYKLTAWLSLIFHQDRGWLQIWGWIWTCVFRCDKPEEPSDCVTIVTVVLFQTRGFDVPLIANYS